jgi:riboflavin kinase/FMN adenylyltransferase
MRVIRGLINQPRMPRGCVATIGNFDGVHLGHQAVITKLAVKGREMNLPVVVILLEPQPLEYFRSRKVPARLSRLREKVILLGRLPVDEVLILRFDQRLSNLTPAEFVSRILVRGLATKYLVVGDDFRFGRNREGDYAMLQDLASEAGFLVEDTGSHNVESQRVSSTLIRDALAVGDLDRAEGFLGRPFSMVGRVVHGRKQGRLIGFPTANIPLFRKNSPIRGVFAVTMFGSMNCEWRGIANVGIRPTFGGTPHFLLEVHIFDCEADLYGRNVKVRFHEKIRNEYRFASVDELKLQIGLDVIAAREILDRRLGAVND